MAQNAFRADIASTLAERTALLAAIASTGRTFGRGLMPRTTAGQALATGLTGSVNYGLVATSQSLLWAGASLVAPRVLPVIEGYDDESVMHEYRARVRLLAYGTYLTTGLASRPLQRLVAQQPGESVSRGLTRSWLERTEQAAIVGLIATATSDLLYDGMRRAHLGRGSRRLIGGAAMLGLGTALATSLVQRERVRRAQATGEPVPPLSPRSVAIGAGTALGLTALGKGEALAAHAIGRSLPDAVPSPAGTAVGHVVCLSALGVGIWQGVEALYRNTEHAGSAIETLHADPPTNRCVSGGPASHLAWAGMTREGRRFAALPLTTQEITEVMGSAASEPVRVFVPLSAADTAEERASIALEEMEALGAFDRSLLVLCSPTGTGYVNYVMAEAVEYLTRGDCAIVTTQYSLRPSFLSLDRVRVGRHNARALIEAVHAHLAAMPAERRPRVVQFGESLGAHTGQDVMMHGGARAFAERGIERALFIGTPDESAWAKEWRADPVATDPDGIVAEVDSFEELEALPAHRRAAARIVLLSHHEDPITKFGPELAIRQPGWLAEDRAARPPGIPPEMDWRPLTTLFVTVADVMNAMTVVPGQFGADGHDYREDLARFVSVVYDLPCNPEELSRIEAALRRRELLIAQSRLVAEQLGGARAKAEATMAGWGVDVAAADALIDHELARVGSGEPAIDLALDDVPPESAPEQVIGRDD
ncbi:MAG TPA: alpha/beta-hydrolase family protein [Candidatus Nanopelagicales bacterium]